MGAQGAALCLIGMCATLIVRASLKKKFIRGLPTHTHFLIYTLTHTRNPNHYSSDYGTPYTLLSAIATGGVNAVVCDIPARDEGEFNAFPATAPFTSASLAMYNHWLDFARENRGYLLRTSFLPAPPGAGIIDGTYAISPSNNTGFIFLFNPNSPSNYTPPGLLVADGINLGLNCTPGVEIFAISELWPVPTPAFTTVACGANFSIAVEGRNARVLSIAPATTSSSQDKVTLFGRAIRPGWSASLLPDSSLLKLHVKGYFEDAAAPGGNACPPSPPLFALIPTALAPLVSGVNVRGLNGVVSKDGDFSITKHSSPSESSGQGGDWMSGCWPQPRSFSPSAPATPPGFTLFAISRQYSGASAAPPSFAHNSPVIGMEYNASFSGGLLQGTVFVPDSVFSQLSQRPYPVPWTSDDLAISWLAPQRLLLYVDGGHSLQASSSLSASLDGSPLPLLPSWSCRTTKRDSCFMGWWADVSSVTPNTNHSLSVTLPHMTPGTFQGVYYDNVDTVYSSLNQ